MDEVNEKMYRLESEIEVKQEKDENIVEMCEEIEIKEEVEMNKFGYTEQNAENVKRLVKTEEAEQKSCGGNIETYENKNMDEVNENMYRLESEIKVKQEKDENIVEMYEEIEIKEEVEMNELKDFFEQNAENVKRSVITGEAEQKLSGANTEAIVQNAELGSGHCKMLSQSVQCSLPVQYDVPAIATAADFEVLQFQLRQVTAERDALHTENVKRKMECVTHVQEIAKLCDSLRCATDAANTNWNNLRSCLSDSQLVHALDGKPVKWWSEEDISRALTLRSLSHKTYRFLREKWQLPLPSTSVLNHWIAKLELEPGILLSVINLLKCKSETMTEQERVCVLSFDKCNLSKQWSYDKASDKIYGPHKSVQFVMLRGVFAPWKQIIFYEFDCPMTKKILFDLIVRVEAAGFPVVATVNDLRPTNVRLWNTLDVSPEKSSFTNPADKERQIYAFTDVRHLLKLIRNNFLDYGFKMADGKLVNSECVRELIARTDDLKVTHRLSQKHIHVQGANRMNVKLAAHLLSEATGKSLKYFGERGLLHSKDWDSTSDFILLTDAWFDLFNAILRCDRKETRNAYGTNLEKQNLILSRMIETVQSMNVCGNQNKFQFQEGLLISSHSLPKLFEMLRDKYGISFLITYRLNQVGLEHFFGSIRKMGGLCDYPNPVSVKHRLRVHLLGAENSITGDNSKSEACGGNSLSEISYTNKEANAMTDKEKLQKELNISAMLFSSLSNGDLEQESNDED
ncbi:transposable element P transposase isoform X4 [Panulirus ornatus]|uniref:transposable element P transposase isoform X4 n=1 Tax=Panulirus ornatus TaxID=150431 RepID=UPI003A88E8DE